ncbi:MAG: peptide chain release factor N(5)-glutamine methyltransferase [Actinobacteria bacterium]|uniref:peptide chain release factor N(5)-glutamine methyltransferase n=1 Tax=freshwater metagenome TaxID=449393 RepID=A0A6J6ZNH9_9ZZZZ|nr:peptide chain release factor N(5)-glutamine methyltransferase [Actinomycetota bacterium]MSX86567.1 peptide chain release factor N(5)-glutamine methyltransferase [Actinomycetota bacterium]MSY70856.1 peptide chain release factor N(5)-glutamine methyltransferase [Actinomycetota bacterium]
MSTISLRSLVAEATDRLRDVADAPEAESRWLVERATGLDATELRFALDRPVTEREIAHFDRMLARRVEGEPLQYILGSWAFRRLDLYLDRRVLIPRPETEIVTEVALAELDRAVAVRAARGDAEPSRAVDLGTGSGAIALSIAIERTTARVWATDASAAALDIARANLVGIGRHASRVQLAHGDWFDALDAELAGTFDLVVSNPPYVAEADELPDSVRAWEPVEALTPGPTGLEAYEVLVPGALTWLRPAGSLVVEIGETQAAAVRAMAERHGYAHTSVHQDLVGRDRAVVMRR